MNYETAILSSGLRIICARSHSNVGYIGVAVDAGTRDELPEESGVAHFSEHLSFKGTRRRRARQILRSMERVGGDLNAYTTKEETMYYCTFLKKDYAKAIDVLMDITLHSTVPQEEMDKEVEVVIDEIEGYNDSPGELIYDEFEGLLFGGHSLGRSILGEATRLRKLHRTDVLRFRERLYRPERMVLFFYGDVPMKDIVRQAERVMFRYPPRLSSVEIPARTKPSVGEMWHEKRIKEKGTHQAHVLMGARCYSALHPAHPSLFLLSNLLGGPAMSSRLNLALRERKGLVYTVESSLTSYTDSGVWGVYFGCDAGDVERCIRLVRRELQRLVDAPLSPSQLRALKHQTQGQISIAWENGENVAIGMGKRYLHYGRTLTCEQFCSQIEALTAQQLWNAAQEIMNPNNITTLIYR